MIDERPNLARMTQMGGTPAPGFDPAALLVIVLIVGAGVALGITALRRRPKVPRWLKLGRVRKRLDVIRRDLDRMVEHAGELRDAEPAVSQPFGLGLAAMTACQWDKAIEHYQEARTRAGRSQLVPLLVQIGVCHYMQGCLVDALKEFGESSRLADREGDKPGRAAALANIGVIHHEYGELGSALTHLNQALAISRESGDQRGALPRQHREHSARPGPARRCAPVTRGCAGHIAPHRGRAGRGQRPGQRRQRPP